VNVAITQQQALREATIRAEEGRALIAACLHEAVGGIPSDVTVSVVVAVGKPGPELLAQAWRDDDLLVLGTRGGRRWHHLRRASVSRYCTRRARCPVLVVPNDEANYAAALDDLRHDLRQLGSGPSLPPTTRRPAARKRAS
jgi:nucleotide-binding universal stress UspA family protein